MVNGNYAVVISKNGCVDTSNCISVIGIGINEQMANSNIRLYPNPVADKLIIENDKVFNKAHIKVTSYTGQKLSEQMVTHTNQAILDMSPYARGIYFVEILENGNRLIRKICKE